MKGILAIVLWVIVWGLVITQCQAATVTLEWNPNHPNDSVTGYELLIGTASGQYSRVEPVGKITRFKVSGLEPETTYYFALKAINENGKSLPSAEISHATPPAPEFVKVTLQRGTNLTGWADVHTEEFPKIEAEFFRLKIETP